MADTNFFSMGADALFLELHRGLVERDPLRVEAAANAAEQHWAFAAARRERSKLRELNEKLTQAAMTAEAVAGGEFSEHRWSDRWQALAEVGELMLTADTAAVTAEDRQLLRRFDHAESAILQLRHIATVASLQQALAMKSLQACWNHLNRLVRHGLVVRLSEGVYGLSPRGERAAERLAREKSPPPRGERAEQSNDLLGSVFELREAWEPRFAEDLAKRVQYDQVADGKLRSIERTVTEMDRMLRSKSPTPVVRTAHWRGLGLSFHSQIAELSDSTEGPKRKMFTRGVYGLTRQLCRDSMSDARIIVDQHGAIVKAIKAGNQDEARQEAVHHLEDYSQRANRLGSATAPHPEGP
ncbi:MAG TPA: FCD domain-containing protein [Chloroflexota bacterium]|nr:FCD domain-containing protein [Chloroflexota bacterium]